MNTGSDVKGVGEEKISEEHASELMRNSENSEISAYRRNSTDGRICKFCEFFGCNEDCDIAKESRRKHEQNKRAVRVKEEGIEYMQNELGLIDFKKTEKLF